MVRRRYQLVVIACLIGLEIGWAAPSQADINTWKDQMKSGQQLMAAGKYSAAELCFRKALTIAIKDGIKGNRLALTKNNLAVVLNDEHKSAEAEKLYQEALAALKQDAAPNVRLEASIKGSLGQLFRETGRGGAGTALANEALQMKRVVSNDDSVRTSLNNEALATETSGNLDKAEKLYQELIEASPKSDLILGVALSNFARVRTKQRNFKEAESLHAKALQIVETTGGKKHSALATVLNDYANFCEHTGNRDKAIGMYRQAIEINSALPKDNPDRQRVERNYQGCLDAIKTEPVKP